MIDPSEITELLNNAARGDRAVGERLWATVYREAKRIAHPELAGGSEAETLSTTGFAHEAYIRLSGTTSLPVDGRRHFYGLEPVDGPDTGGPA